MNENQWLDIESTSRLTEIISRFRRPKVSEPDNLDDTYWMDCIGVLTRCAFRKEWMTRAGKRINEIDPSVELEWFALMRSIEEAKDSYCAIELGAGYAPWLVRAAVAWIRMHGANNLDLVAVEGEPTHVSFIRQHFYDNNIPASVFEVIAGAISTIDGHARFEIANDASSDWGTRIADSPVLVDVPRVPDPVITDVSAYRLDTVIANRERVDIVHMDIQGSEFEVLEVSSDIVASKVKRILIGTHGRAIEGQLLQLLTSLDFRLYAEHPCTYSLRRDPPVVVRDGTQYWVNLRTL